MNESKLKARLKELSGGLTESSRIRSVPGWG